MAKVEREWGYYDVLSEEEGSLTKCLVFNGEKPLSLQRHHLRTEKWMCAKGRIEVTVNNRTHTMLPGSFMTIYPDEWHTATGEEGATIIEVWLGHNLSEEDIERK